MNRPNTVTELLKMITIAADRGDVDGLEELANVADDWIQTDEERDAQINLINLLIEMVEERG